MSVEFTALLLSLTGVVIAVTMPLIGMLGWMIRRMDKGFESQTNILMGRLQQFEERMDSHFDEQEQVIDAFKTDDNRGFDEQHRTLNTVVQEKYIDARLDEQGRQLADIKEEMSHFRNEQSRFREELHAVAVAVARYEGPVSRSS